MNVVWRRIAIIVVLIISGSAIAADDDLWDPEGKSDSGVEAKRTIAKIGLDLTGRWSCNDGGTYYIRQTGREVWWLGRSGDDGKRFTNIFHGQISSDARSIAGRWADIPAGAARGSGQLRLLISASARLNVDAQSGGFGGSEWTR